MDILDCVKYDENSPSGLVWTKDIKGLWHRKHTLVSAGDAAGSLTTEGYWQIKFKRKVYRAHRIVWELCQGPLSDDNKIDHVNRDRTDNRIINLRIATHTTNMQNKSMNKCNSSGRTGVYWHVNASGVTSAQAFWVQGGVKKSKSFSTTKYGLLPAFNAACKYRIAKIEELNALGANYTKTHGA